MPIPTPTGTETLEEFMTRCMADDSMNSDWPDQEQRAGVCSTAWEGVKEARKMAGYSFVAPIAWKDEAKRIVYGPVLVPGVPDSDGDVVSAEKVEAVAHKFLEEYRIMEHMHTLRSIARPVESYIAPSDLQFNGKRIPKGSWVVGAKVQDDDAWNDVVAGKLTGFSIVAVPTGAKKSASNKRVTLRDIEESGSDWEVVAIGLVDKPAVPLAKWLAVKQKEPGLWEQFKALFDATDKAGRTISDANLAKLLTAQEGMNAFREVIQDLVGLAETERQAGQKQSHERRDDMDVEEIKELIGSAVSDTVKETIKPLTDRLDALEGAGEESDKSKEKSKEKDDKDSALTEERVAEMIAEGIAQGLEKAGDEFEDQLQKTLQSKFSGKSLGTLTESLRGQDGHTSEKKEPSDTRDPWGRRIKKEVSS